MYKTETHLTLLGLLFTFGNISKLRNLHAHLHTICNHSIIKLKACLQKCKRSSSHKGNTIFFYPFGPLVCIWNNFQIPKLSCASTRYMQPFYNKIKSLPSKMYKSQESVTDGRTDGLGDNIPELSLESAGIKSCDRKIFVL